MIREIVRDPFFLQQKSFPAGREDIQIAIDLLDTLKAHQKECIGMAANMIGERKNIIAVNNGKMNAAMLNPVILHKSEPYSAKEGCLSLEGVRETIRYRQIELAYQDLHFKKCRQKYSGLTAEIIQHECDHLNGILI